MPGEDRVPGEPRPVAPASDPAGQDRAPGEVGAAGIGSGSGSQEREAGSGTGSGVAGQAGAGSGPAGRPVRRSATMRDVARQAGVGLATVSRVINGKPGVAPELVRRVTETARALGYRHDVTASSLRRADRRTATIALVLEDVANPFSSAVHRAVEDTAREADILVLAGSSDEHPDRERELIDAFTLRRVDGLIVLPTGGTDEQLAAVRRHGTPVVCADRLVEIDRVDTVTVDNRDGTWAAVPIPFIARLPFAIAIVVWGARTNRRWTVPVAGMLALPALWYGGLSMLLAVIVLREQDAQADTDSTPVAKPLADATA